MDKIQGGLFAISEDHIEKYQSLDVRFIKNKAATFFFETEGDAMAPLILPQDVLVVDRSITALNQHIVVASVDNQMICRRLVRQAGQFFFHPENPKYPDYKIDQDRDVVIFGVVRSLVREFYK